MTPLSRFFNRYVLLHALIVLLSTLALYAVPYYVGASHNGWFVAAFLLYLTLIPLSVVFLNRRDDFTGYGGFNYHFVTYLACVAIPLLLNAFGRQDLRNLSAMAFTWGIGVVVHFLIFWFWFRKRSLRNYDKREIFQ